MRSGPGSGRSRHGCASRGITTALTAIEIAVAAVRVNAELWTRDSDFTRIATVLDSLSLFAP